jgi:hypothetical protein
LVQDVGLFSFAELDVPKKPLAGNDSCRLRESQASLAIAALNLSDFDGCLVSVYRALARA